MKERKKKKNGGTKKQEEEENEIGKIIKAKIIKNIILIIIKREVN